MTLGKMTDADKVMNPKDFGRDPANIQIRINPEIHVWILDQFWLRLDMSAEVCTPLSAILWYLNNVMLGI